MRLATGFAHAAPPGLRAALRRPSAYAPSAGPPQKYFYLRKGLPSDIIKEILVGEMDMRGQGVLPRCPTTESFQPWPKEGKLRGNLNKNLEDLKSDLRGFLEDTVYAYLLATIEFHEHRQEFRQTGSAPNFQGGLVTLCTCKHYMRTYREPQNWEGIWVAGFSYQRIPPEKSKRYWLIYLMKIGRACASFADLWKTLPSPARNAKNARYHPLGDLYQPKPELTDPYNPLDYYEPCSGHSHEKNWKKDIAYRGIKDRYPALLVGDLEKSFIWSRPMIYIEYHPRTKKWILGDLLKISLL